MKLDFPLILLFHDWLNCWLEVLIIAIEDCGDGVDGTTTGSDSLFGVLTKNQNFSIVPSVKFKPPSRQNGKTIM